MTKENEELQDGKGLGQPPPYTPSYPAAPEVIHPTNNMPVQPGPILAPVAGQPTQTGGTYLVHAAPVVLPVLVGNKMGPKSTSMTCPSCKEVIVTRVEARANTKTHMGAVFLCFSVCCLPFVWVPYILDKCRNADHYCPNCSAYIGSYVH